jgi:hypothetical protein
MSLRDDNRVEYNYLNELDWVSHNTAQRSPIKKEDKLKELTKVVEDLQNRIEVLESIEQKNWDQKMDS